MPLTSGTKLGHTKFSRRQVPAPWARSTAHTRLDRIVALKILPAAFSSDLDCLQRFQHEARILRTLNHPNVLAIFDVGETGRKKIRYL